MEPLDLRGLNCPMPLLRTKKSLARVEPGEELKVLVTDPGAEADLRLFCEKTGHVFVSAEPADDGAWLLTVRHK